MSKENEEVTGKTNNQLISALPKKTMIFYLVCSFVFFFLGTFHIWTGFKNNHEFSKYIVGIGCLAIATGYIFLIKFKNNKK